MNRQLHGVAETSKDAFFSNVASHFFEPKEIRILEIFGPATRLSRQQISEITRFPINTCCGRVDSLLTKGALAEEGERRDAATGKRQKLLRLPAGQLELLL